MLLRVRVSKDPKVYNAQYLTLLNGMLKLFPRQLEVLIAIANKQGRVTRAVRKELTSELSFGSTAALNMIIHELRKKQILIDGEKRGELFINKAFEPRKTEKLIFELHEA